MSHYIACPRGHGDDMYDVDTGCPRCDEEDAVVYKTNQERIADLERQLAEVRAIVHQISTHPDVAKHAGVGDGSVADAVTALAGEAIGATQERDALKAKLKEWMEGTRP